MGIKEHFPEFYNSSMEQMQNDSNEPKQFFSVNLKDFTTKMPTESTGNGEKKTAVSGGLNKFITGRKTMQHPEVSEQNESPRKQVPSTIKSKSNMRYQVTNENLDMDSPEHHGHKKQYNNQTEKKQTTPQVDYSARLRGSIGQTFNNKNADMPRLSTRT